MKVDRILARRHTLTNYFFALSQHLPTARLSRVLELATTANVELMTHPQVDAEYDCLMSDSYAQSISGTAMGDYRLL